MVEVEHSTEALAPTHRLRWREHRGGPQELICEALMIAFGVVVRHEVADRVLKRALSEEDHSGQALGRISPRRRLRIARCRQVLQRSRIRLGADFLAEVEKACLRLGEHQALGPRLDADHRRLALRRFPFGLIYRLRFSKAQIVPVAHRRRRPGHWMQQCSEGDVPGM